MNVIRQQSPLWSPAVPLPRLPHKKTTRVIPTPTARDPTVLNGMSQTRTGLSRHPDHHHAYGTCLGVIVSNPNGPLSSSRPSPCLWHLSRRYSLKPARASLVIPTYDDSIRWRQQLQSQTRTGLICHPDCPWYMPCVAGTMSQTRTGLICLPDSQFLYQ